MAKKDVKTTGSGSIAAKALQQLKDQSSRSRNDIEGEISRKLEMVQNVEQKQRSKESSEGAVGDLIQEIQRQMRLLQGDARDLPHQMILVSLSHLSESPSSSSGVITD